MGEEAGKTAYSYKGLAIGIADIAAGAPSIIRSGKQIYKAVKAGDSLKDILGVGKMADKVKALNPGEFVDDVKDISKAEKATEKVAEGTSELTAGNRYLNVPYSKVSRGVRNTEILTDAQKTQIYQHIDELGLNPDDFHISPQLSCYSDDWDITLLGPNMFPASTRKTRSILETITPRAAIAHETGHMITTRAGTAFEGGTLYDEVLASLTGRNLRGLNELERYQLLRDAAERAKIEGQKLRDIITELGVK